MAITIVGTVQIGNERNGGDVTLTFDGTPAEDDVVVVIGGHGNENGSDPIGPSTAGYTTEDDTDDGADDWTGGVWTKVLGASPDATVVCLGSGATVDAAVYAAYVLRGVDTANIMDAALVLTSRVTTDNPDPDSITTVTDDAWVIAAVVQRYHATATAFPSGYTNTATAGRVDTNRFGVSVATSEIASFGAENPGAFTISVGSSLQAAYTIAIRPASGAALVKVEGESIGLTEGEITALGLVRLEPESLGIVEGQIRTMALVRIEGEALGVTEVEIVLRPDLLPFFMSMIGA